MSILFGSRNRIIINLDDDDDEFVGRLRGISLNPRAGTTVSPHEKLKVKLLESYQRPR